MADKKLSALTELAATPAVDDEVYIRDISELAAAESKRITTANLLGSCLLADGSRALAGAWDMGSQVLTNVNIDGGTIDGVTITSPTINGTIATTGLTMPAFTIGGTVTVNGQSFDAGSGKLRIDSTGSEVLELVSTRDLVYGAVLILEHISASPAVNDRVGIVYFVGRNDAAESVNYGWVTIQIADKGDGTEDGKFRIDLKEAGANNEALRLTSAGVLSVDASGIGAAAQVDEFDSFDDALLLRKGFSGKQMEVLEDIGIAERKDTGSGWMISLLGLGKLCAGGVYQNRAKIDDMDDRLGKLELALAQGGS